MDIQILLSLPLLLTLWWAAQKVVTYLRRRSIAFLQGPDPGRWLVGNLPEIFNADYSLQHELKWADKYGTAFRIKGPLGSDILYLADPKALQYILNTSGYNYKKPQQQKVRSTLITGGGLNFAEGEVHARQRRIMTPAFHFSTLREFLPRFRHVARKTVNKWQETIQQQGGKAEINLTPWLSKTTLDALGETAFDYRFDSLDEGHSELSKVYSNLIPDFFYKRHDAMFVMEAVWGLLPFHLVTFLLRFIPTRRLDRVRKYMKVARSVAGEIVSTQIKAYTAGKEGSKDIMSILIRANMSENPKTKLDDASIMAQMTTFMFAGHETTSSTLSWFLHELSNNPDAQKRLREEIQQTKAHALARGDAELTVVDIESMKYLSSIIKETLRIRGIITLLTREANKDDIIPLLYPVQTKSGETVTSIPISKGQKIYLALGIYNRLKSVWGEDALEWRPERFLLEDQGTKQKTSLGVISNVATFGSGHRSCIGWRFALTELQTLIIEFLENFQFVPAVPKDDIIATPGLVGPMLKGHEGKMQLPMILTPATE